MPGRRLRGFTLIEVMATVAIFALLAAVALPNLRITRDRATREEARRLATDLELVRSRALATGVPHRLRFDIDGARWTLEWWVSEARSLGEEPVTPPEVYLPGVNDPVLMAPPQGLEPSFRALPGTRPTVLPAEVELSYVETGGLEVRQGRVSVTFGRDGSTEPTRIRLADDSGSSFDVVIAPFSDHVRVERAETR